MSRLPRWVAPSRWIAALLKIALLAPVTAAGAEPDPFAAFEPLAVSPETLRSMAVPDTLPPSPLVTLLDRYSYAPVAPDTFAVRNHFVLRIDTAAAAEWFQTYRIPFESDEDPPVVRAAVHRPDGRSIAVDPRAIVVASAPAAGDEVRDRRAVVIPFPSLAPGDIVELVVERRRFPQLGRGVSSRFGMQSPLPVQESIVEVFVPDGIPFATAAYHGGVAAVVTNAPGGRIFRWRWSDRGTLANDPMMPAALSFLPWSGWSTHAGWESTSRGYRDRFWQSVAAAPAAPAALKDALRRARGIPARVDSVTAFVVRQVRYLAVEMGPGRFHPSPASEVWDRGYGDCKDMVALTLALLRDAGIEAEPVLVASSEDTWVVEDLVNPSGFDHVLIRVPLPEGDRFVDPTVGAGAATPVPPAYAGTLGLALPRDGDPRLIRLPDARPEDHGFHSTIELTPLDDRNATIHIRTRFRGALAVTARTAAAVADSAARLWLIERLLWLGRWETVVLEKWRVTADRGSWIELEGSFRDTAWSADEHTVNASLLNEVADPLTAYPDLAGRRTPVRFETVFRDTVQLLLRPGGGWLPPASFYPCRVTGTRYAGQVSATSRGRDEGAWLDVLETFELGAGVMDTTAYRSFHQDWVRMRYAAAQPFVYRKSLDEQELSRLGAYAREHPEDALFALQAAVRVLGSDLGGRGPEGERRRGFARRLVEPVRVHPDAGVPALILLSSLEAGRGRFRAADSLASLACRAEPSNSAAMGMALAYKVHLDDLEGALRIVEQAGAQYAGLDLELAHIGLLESLNRHDEAETRIRRLFALHPGADSTALLALRLGALSDHGRCEEARHLLAADSSRIAAEERTELLLAAARTCVPFDELRAAMERRYFDNPLDHEAANLLAWIDALAGRNLVLAEELANSASMLAPRFEESSARNTLGVVWLRQGRTGEARRLFEELLARDDRPAVAAANQYFLAACDARDGRPEAGRERWQRLVRTGRADASCRAAERALALLGEGRPFEEAAFEAWTP